MLQKPHINYNDDLPSYSVPFDPSPHPRFFLFFVLAYEGSGRSQGKVRNDVIFSTHRTPFFTS